MVVPGRSTPGRGTSGSVGQGRVRSGRVSSSTETSWGCFPGPSSRAGRIRPTRSIGQRRGAHMTSAVPDVESRAEAVLAALDEEQREAAQAVSGPVCILAGAGTGKTRTITHRIAYGVHTGVYVPEQVLAVTFPARA